MRNSNGKAAVSIILIIIILLLAGYIVYDKVLLKDSIDQKEIADTMEETNKTNDSINIEQENYNVSDIVGYYELVDENDLGSTWGQFYGLSLFNDGTFRYEFGEESNAFIVGNYTIEGNKILLNYLFCGSASEEGHEKGCLGNKTLIISNSNTITDQNSYIVKGREISLNKKTTHSNIFLLLIFRTNAASCI